MTVSTVGRVLVAMSLITFKSYDDYTQSMSAISSSAANYYYRVSNSQRRPGPERSASLSAILEITVNKPKLNQDDLMDALELDGLILARQGSKGILHKNMAFLNGKPLIHYALTAMIQSQVFPRIWVSTDDPLIVEYIKTVKNTINESVKIKIHNRVLHTATDEATSLMAVQEFLHSHPEIEAIGLIQITSPFIQPSFLSKAAHLMNTKRLDSIFSVTRQHKLRWSEVISSESETTVNLEQKEIPNNLPWTTAVNFNPKSRPRRQDWPGELIENGMFYFVTRNVVLNGLLQGPRSYYYEVHKNYSLEIDSADDLAYAEILMRKQNNLF